MGVMSPYFFARRIVTVVYYLDMNNTLVWFDCTINLLMRKTLPTYYLVEVNTCRCTSFYQYMYTYFEALSEELGNS